MKASKQCDIDGCDGKYIAKGLCNKHYLMNKKYGDPMATHFGFKGQSKHPLYFTWRCMHRRCDTPSQERYERYGGRGIRVCDRWSGPKGFKHFLEDMGEKPNDEYQLDRIDNDGNYEPSNCRWATRSENQINKSTGKDNTSGYKGVGLFTNSRGKTYWRARMGKNTVGYYETFLEAMSGRLFAEENLLNEVSNE